MKKILPIFIVAFCLACSSEEIDPGETFVKYYGDNANFELKDMIHRADGEQGVVILAQRIGDVASDDGNSVERQDFYLVMTNGRGDAQIEQRLPVILPSVELESENAITPAKITALSEGYLVVGSLLADKKDDSGGFIENEFASIIVWARLNNQLELAGGAWNIIGDSTNNYFGTDIAPTADGGVLIAGFNDVNLSNDFFYTKTGGSGNEWSRTQVRFGSDDRLIRALPTGAGQFALFGRTDILSEDGESGANVERTVIDQDGVITNSLVYGITWPDGTDQLWDIPSDVVETPGGFTIVGTSYTNQSLETGAPFLMNVDLTGGLSTEVSYVEDLNPDFSGNVSVKGGAFGVVRGLDNDFLLVGEADGFDGDTELGKQVMIFGADQAGERETAIRLYGLINGDETAYRALVTNNGILVGAVYDFGSGANQLTLLKVNRKGELKP